MRVPWTKAGHFLATGLLLCVGLFGCGSVAAVDDEPVIPCSFGHDETCDDGNTCTVDKCTVLGDCTHTAAENVCKVDGVCYPDGTANPDNLCELCDMARSVWMWSEQLCDDDNACTADSCATDGTCTSLPDNALSCDDGEVCTTDDHCEEGQCVASPCGAECAVDMDCASDSPCQLTSCFEGHCIVQNATNETPCDDGNKCTQVDSCQEGACVGTSPVVCIPMDACHDAGSCDPATGDCSVPTAQDGTVCTDGSICTENDSCSAGICIGTPVVCDDGNACSADTCNPLLGGCVSDVLGCACQGHEDCDDGNPCNGVETCDNGTQLCLAGTPTDCAAQSDACNTGACDATTGECVAIPTADGNPCDDNNACTQVDACWSGQCQGADAVACPAQTQCQVAGTCDPESGACSSPSQVDGTLCDDGDHCTQTDTCQGGLCASGPSVTCTSIGQCHSIGTCNPATGKCTNPPKVNDTACDDGSPCTSADVCQDGQCQGTAINCDDGVDCTLDSCDLNLGGCTHDASPCNCTDDGDCDDGNPCNGVETCDAAKQGCVLGTVVDCSELDGPCHTGTCQNDGTCAAISYPAGSACDDDDPTTGNELCTDEAVCVGVPLSPECGNGVVEAGEDCDDGNDNSDDGCSNACEKIPFADCAAVLHALPGSESGVYTIDPDGEDGKIPFDVYCEMSTGGGGWSLVAVSSDDGKPTWTWNNRHLMTTNKATVGSLDNTHQDFKSPAYHRVNVHDLLFVHSTPSDPDNPVWAQYDGVSDGEASLGVFLAGFPENINYYNKAGIPMTGGTLTATQQLCSTELYINPCGLDGEDDCTTDDNTFGPAWSVNNYEGCPLDDPGHRGGIGPDSESKSHEYHHKISEAAPGVGFGTGLGLNTGTIGSGENHIKIFVRRSL